MENTDSLNIDNSLIEDVTYSSFLNIRENWKNKIPEKKELEKEKSQATNEGENVNAIEHENFLVIASGSNNHCLDKSNDDNFDLNYENFDVDIDCNETNMIQNSTALNVDECSDCENNNIGILKIEKIFFILLFYNKLYIYTYCYTVFNNF